MPDGPVPTGQAGPHSPVRRPVRPPVRAPGRPPGSGRPQAGARALADRATSLLLSRPPGIGRTRLGVVDGPSGSGKTTFATLWAGSLQLSGLAVVLFSSDLLATWADPFGWFDRFDSGVLLPLAQGRPGRIQLTEWTDGAPRPGGWLDVPVVDVLLLEGVSAGRATLGDRVGVGVFLPGAARAERLERAVARDGESARANLARWQEVEDAFFAQDRPADRADFLVDPDLLGPG